MRLLQGLTHLRLFGLGLIAASLAVGTAYAAIGRMAHPSRLVLPVVSTAPYGAQKVVYHLTESGGWFGQQHRKWLSNIENHFAAVGDELDMVVVMNGDGVEFLRSVKDNANMRARVDALKVRGVRFLICRNTLEAHGIDPFRDLYDVAREDIVPAGVAEIARFGAMGYSYLRP